MRGFAVAAADAAAALAAAAAATAAAAAPFIVADAALPAFLPCAHVCAFAPSDEMPMVGEKPSGVFRQKDPEGRLAFGGMSMGDGIARGVRAPGLPVSCGMCSPAPVLLLSAPPQNVADLI